MEEKDRRNRQDMPPERLTEEEINSPEFDPDEFAPAPSRHTATRVPNMKSTLFLVILCVACALVLAVTNVLTAFAAEKGERDIRRNAVLELFPRCDRAELYDTIDDCSVYVVYYSGRLAGYAVFVSEDGYIGPIEILVAMDADNKVSQVQIVSHSESEGLGSKITQNTFLSQFVGMPDEDMDVDLISGATLSSRAVRSGVDRVLDLGLDFFAIAEDLGVETISAKEMEEELQKEEETDADTTADETTGNAVTTRPGDDTVFGGDNVGGPNSNTGGGDVSASGEDGTTVYETETEEPEETTEETTAETEAPPDTVPVTTAPPQTEPPATETTAPPQTEPPQESTTPEETTGPAEETTGSGTETTGGGGWPGWN